jgi:Zn-dependent peptidase ImmA (M78 family)
MIKTTKNIKQDVFNPINLFNTIGEELYNLIIIHEKSVDDFLGNMGWSDLKSIKKISKKDLLKIENWFQIEDISDYISNFQEDYKQKEIESSKTYKEYKALYKKFCHLIHLVTPNFNSGIDLFSDFADFVGVEDEKDILNSICEQAALYKISGGTVDKLNLFVWRRRGEELFKSMNLPNYDKIGLSNWVKDGSWKNHLTDISYFKTLPKLFETFGVGLILEPFLPKTVYGLVDWIEQKPLIQISDREKNLAVCWYTLFHEIGHVLLHENHQIFEESFEKTKKKEIILSEHEANQFAYKYLFGGDGLRKRIFQSRPRLGTETDIKSLAKQFNTHPMFASYWLIKANLSTHATRNLIPKIQF